NLLDLPNEILYHIIENLSSEEIKKCSLVCKKIYEIVRGGVTLGISQSQNKILNQIQPLSPERIQNKQLASYLISKLTNKKTLPVPDSWTPKEKAIAQLLRPGELPNLMDLRRLVT